MCFLMFVIFLFCRSGTTRHIELLPRADNPIGNNMPTIGIMFNWIHLCLFAETRPKTHLFCQF